MKGSIMKEFIESKGLLDEFMIFEYNKQEGNKERLTDYRKKYYSENKGKIYKYIPNGSKLVKKERDEDIVRMRSEGKTLQYIADKKGITHQTVSGILKKQNL